MIHSENKIIDDLDYLSELGFETIPGAKADLNALRKRIAQNYPSSSGFSNYFIAMMLGLFLGITLFFKVYNSSMTFSFSTHTTQKSISRSASQNVQSIFLDTILITSPKKERTPVRHEKFIEPEETDPSDKNETVEPLHSIQNPVLKNEESYKNDHLKYAANAPVIYLHDLKIANYHVNYFNAEKNIVVGTGVPAKYEDKEDQKAQNSHFDRHYYLHNAIDDAMLLFKRQKYKECITLLDMISEYNANDINCLFYKGMSFYYLQKYQNAYDQFKLAEENPVNVFEEENKFYTALCALKIGHLPEADQLLKEIETNQGFYAKNAREMLLNSKK